VTICYQKYTADVGSYIVCPTSDRASMYPTVKHDKIQEYRQNEDELTILQVGHEPMVRRCRLASLKG
jgi:hypothetical protein